MRKRILSFIMMLIMVISLFPVSVSATESYSSGLTLEQLKAKFPHDKYWNHMGSSSNNQDGWTETPCSSHDSLSTCNAFIYNGIEIGWQCFGFACKLGYDAYGSNPKNWERTYSLDNIKPGDIINYDGANPGHTVFVIGVSGDTVTFAECNKGENKDENECCIIKWGRKLKKSQFNDLYSVYVAPYDLLSASNTSNCDLRVQYWVSEKGKGWTAEQATEATQFQTGKTYYFWYKIYDAISGKYLNELYPSLNYDVQMTLFGPKGKLGSCSYSKSDCNWYGITVTEAGTYTCEISISGDIRGSGKTGFKIAAGIKKPTVYMDKSSISLTVGETTTCTVGVIPYDASTVNYGSENGNICEASVGEITYSQELVSIPLKITGLTPGKTNVKLHFLNSSGNTLATSTISVMVKPITATTGAQVYPYITDVTWDDGKVQDEEDEEEYHTVEAYVMGITGANNTLTIDAQSEITESTEAAAAGNWESSFMVTLTPESTAPTTSNESSKIQFSDVRKSDYYYESVGWAVNNKITTGTTKTTFSPTVECTNAHFITFLWRAAGYPDPKTTVSLTDVSENDYFYKAAMWALEKGLIFAYSDGGFHPNQPIFRSDLVTVLWRYAGSPDVESTTPFTDVHSSMPYAKAVKWAVDNNVTTGTSSTTFSPNTICNRAQIVTFLYRYFG